MVVGFGYCVSILVGILQRNKTNITYLSIYNIEIYYKELAHMIREVKKSRSRRAGGIVQI